MKELRNAQDFLDELRRIGVDAMANYYLLEGIPTYFADNWQEYCSFKETIANTLKIHPKTVMLVGSARWGFSTSPNKFPQKFDKGPEPSDLDVVIADSAFFDSTWRELCEHEMDESPKDLGRLVDRNRLLVQGRLDPTMFPKEMLSRNLWNRTFEELSKNNWNGTTPRKVAALIFKDWHFVQKYYRNPFKQILEKHPKTSESIEF